MGRFSAIVQFLVASRAKAAYWGCAALLLAWAALLALFAIKAGNACHTDMPWDTVSMLDGGYRMYCGQKPHQDFFCPIGILPLWLIKLGMQWGGVSANAIVYGSVAGFLALVPMAWLIAARRLPAVPALAFAMFIGGLFVAKRPLSFGTYDYPFECTHLSYAMWYNRIGWALLALLAFYWFLPPFSKKRASGWGMAEAFVAGVLTALLALTKVNYLAGAVGVTLVGLVFARPSLRQLAALAFGIAAVPVGFAFAEGWQWHAWLADTVRLAHVASVADRGSKYFGVFTANLFSIVLLGVAVCLLYPLWPARSEEKWGRLRTLALCAACVGAGLAVVILNTQRAEIPLIVVACVLALETALRHVDLRAASESARFRLGFGAAIAAALLGYTLFNDSTSVVYAWAARNHMRFLTPSSGLISTASLDPLLLPPRPHEQVERAWVYNDLLVRLQLSPLAANQVPMTPYQFGNSIHDGLELLAGRTTPQSRIFAIYHTNPFPMALQLPPPHGGCLWWDPITFNRTDFPEPASVFGDVTHVLVRRVNSGSFAFEDLYLPYIRAHFHKTAESILWDLYERAPGAGE